MCHVFTYILLELPLLLLLFSQLAEQSLLLFLLRKQMRPLELLDLQMGVVYGQTGHG